MNNILQSYMAKYGNPPSEILVNKNDSESIKAELPEGVKVVVDRYVLPRSVFLELVGEEDE